MVTLDSCEVDSQDTGKALAGNGLLRLDSLWIILCMSLSGLVNREFSRTFLGMLVTCRKSLKIRCLEEENMHLHEGCRGNPRHPWGNVHKSSSGAGFRAMITAQ
jgi:hypothetical protein